MTEDNGRFNPDHSDHRPYNYWKPGGNNYNSTNLLISFGPVITGYGNQINLFPVFSELKNK